MKTKSDELSAIISLNYLKRARRELSAHSIRKFIVCLSLLFITDLSMQ